MDLIEEAKKRVVFLIICVVGLSYLMSLTSSSVLINLPAAVSVIIILRYISLDFEMRRKEAAYTNKQSIANRMSQNKVPKIVAEESDWRKKVDSPIVEDAIDHFTRHLVFEWVTGLWYSRITPDTEGPEELVQIMNSILGEISYRSRNINLINLLTRDIIVLICTHLELFRSSQVKMEKQQSGSLTIDQRDLELKRILAAENKLHPALFSTEAEHKVLQILMDGLISFTFKPEDLQCSYFRYTARELLSCAVMRPVLNLSSPRFINERIESLVISVNKTRKAVTAQEACHSKINISSKFSFDKFSEVLDPITGIELIQLRNNHSQTTADKPPKSNVDGSSSSKDPLLSIDTQSTRTWESLPSDFQGDVSGVQRQHSGGDWGDLLDSMSNRKTQALAPEHFENMWAKGKNYREQSLIDQVTVNHLKLISKQKEKNVLSQISNLSHVISGCKDLPTIQNDRNISANLSLNSYAEDDDHGLMPLEEVEFGSDSSCTSNGEEDNDPALGLKYSGSKVWGCRKNRNVSVSQIRHPLEVSNGYRARMVGKVSRTQSGMKKMRYDKQRVHVWQEAQRICFSSGDGQDLLTSLKEHTLAEDSSNDSEIKRMDGIQSGATASSSVPIALPLSSSLAVGRSTENSLLADSFFRLKCEVLGANIVKSGSDMFAVYALSVTDANNNSWSIKRRFRHFEELHRRLKEFPHYNLNLPPKHFLSTSLDMPIIRERCKLLDRYLKCLLQLYTISGSVEVWDFLSVDSQIYIFANSISIMETLSADHVDQLCEKPNEVSGFAGPVINPTSSGREPVSKESTMEIKNNFVGDESVLDTKNIVHLATTKPDNESRKKFKDSSGHLDTKTLKNVTPIRVIQKSATGEHNERLRETYRNTPPVDPILPTEWVPPNLIIPLLNLVDVIFQLRDSGWVRRQFFWISKQVLQLGMGDVFDDWLIEKIQILRRGPVIASAIRRLEQVLWPDGIFITKHPKRQRPFNNQSQSTSNSQQPMHPSSPKDENVQKLYMEENSLSFDEQKIQEANRRAKFVYELMIDNAPAAIVSVIGRKEYEQCARDLYFFIQSPICLKQLGFGLLELLLLSAFPEMDYVFVQLREDAHKFGESKSN